MEAEKLAAMGPRKLTIQTVEATRESPTPTSGFGHTIQTVEATRGSPTPTSGFGHTTAQEALPASDMTTAAPGAGMTAGGNWSKTDLRTAQGQRKFEPGKSRHEGGAEPQRRPTLRTPIPPTLGTSTPTLHTLHASRGECGGNVVPTAMDRGVCGDALPHTIDRGDCGEVGKMGEIAGRRAGVVSKEGSTQTHVRASSPQPTSSRPTS
jgi:hypothetical protein